MPLHVCLCLFAPCDNFYDINSKQFNNYEKMFSYNRIFASARMRINNITSIKLSMQTTELKSKKVDTIFENVNVRNWEKECPLLQQTFDMLQLPKNENCINKTEITSIERRTFIEQCLGRELFMDHNRGKRIYLLCDEYFSKNYLTNESIIQMCNFLKLFFTSDDLYYNPKPIMTPFSVLYNRILLLKEIGFRSFDPIMVDSVQDLLQMTPKELSDYLNYFDEQKCFDSLCKSLEIVGNDKKSLLKFISINYGAIDSVRLCDLRNICVAKYLSTLLKIGFNRTEQVSKSAHKNLSELSLQTIKLNINYLLHEFKYPGNKIIHNGIFAALDPTNLQNISTKLKPITGMSLYNSFISSPAILKTDYEQIVSNFELIKKYCNGKVFSRYIELLTMQHSKLKELFENIESNEDFRMIGMDVLGVDYIALNHKKLLERVRILKTENISLRYIPISYFMTSDFEFNNMVNDIIADADLRVRFFIEDILEMDYNNVKHRLRVIPNLNGKKYNQQNAKRIIEFFIAMNIPKDKIIDSIYLILFDYKQVKSAYFNACSRYDKTLHDDPNFFKHIFDYLLLSHNSGI